VYIPPTVDEAEPEDELGAEEDPTMNPNSAEAIKRRFKRFQQQREKKRVTEANAAVSATPTQIKFKGAISQCFGPYLTIYIQHLVSTPLRPN